MPQPLPKRFVRILADNVETASPTDQGRISYELGQVYEVDHWIAEGLIRRNLAEEVVEDIKIEFQPKNDLGAAADPAPKAAAETAPLVSTDSVPGAPAAVAVPAARTAKKPRTFTAKATL